MAAPAQRSTHGEGRFWLRHPSRPRTALVACAAVVAGIFTGCAGGPPPDPLQTATRRDADPRARLRAVERVDLADDRAAAALYDVLFSDREPDEVRQRLIALLAERDRPRFIVQTSERLTEVDRWPVLEPLVMQLAELGEPRSVGAIVRSWARPSTIYADADRPERAALAKLVAPRRVSEVLVEAFCGLPAGGTLSEQVAAWAVLSRTMPRAELWSVLASAPPGRGLVRDLREAAEVLDVLPRDREGVLWLTAVRDERGGAWWREAAERAAGLTPRQRRGLELRHLPVLREAPADVLRLTRESLAAAIATRLAGRTHVTRTDYGVTGGPASEAFADQRERLTWPDLLTIHTLLDAMEDRAVVAALFAQADGDRADRGTEHGGVLQWSAAAEWTAAGFPPLVRHHDNAFYAAPELIEAMYTGLAHYHFHAQHDDGAPFAGPGGGDLLFADRLRAACLVLTALDRDTLNVDFYTAGRVVVDLGVIRR